MKTEASNNAYQEQIKSGKALILKDKIFAYLCRNNCLTIQHLSEKFQKPKSTITARLDQLEAEGRCYKTTRNEHRMSYYFPIISPRVQKEEKRLYRKKKIERHIKALERLGVEVEIINNKKNKRYDNI